MGVCDCVCSGNLVTGLFQFLFLCLYFIFLIFLLLAVTHILFSFSVLFPLHFVAFCRGQAASRRSIRHDYYLHCENSEPEYSSQLFRVRMG